ncbi:MAG TPA: DUF3616 domain-containing protein [Blastocatellia bacterium]|nr:DUF3616 domain-containing protein [Blastocatellia bacterium]
MLFSAACGSGKKDGGGGGSKSKHKKDAGTPFEGGKFEASGVVAVPGTDGILFIDDSKPDRVFWTRLDQSGKQAGAITPVPLGVEVEDPEGITSDGTFYYVVGSQSRPKSEHNALVRFAFDPKAMTARAEAVKNFRALLIANVPQLKGDGEQKGSDGGLNIEGIAWDPARQQLLLGLRSPIINGQAMLVPVKPPAAGQAFTAESLSFVEPRAISIPLDDLGVRDIQYDPARNSFLIISGAPETISKTDFKLWEWDGNPSSPPSERMFLDEDVFDKPEGISPIKAGGRDMIFIVGDGSIYYTLDYP